MGRSFGLAMFFAGIVLSFWADATHAQPTFAEKPPGIEPIVTREPLFSIPFYLNPRRPRPAELFLYVSGNQGREWTLYQRRGPHQEKFDFQAGEEGEFWFIVRTPYAESAPTVDARPEKIVIVDQTKPTLDVNVQLGPTGQIMANWNVSDPHLDASSFKLTYQGPGDDEWRPVSIRLPVTSGDDTLKGEVSWAVSEQNGKVLVRAEVLDRAGNSSVFQDQVVLNPIAEYSTNSDVPLTPRNPGKRSLPPTGSSTSVPETAVAAQPTPNTTSSFSSDNDGWKTTSGPQRTSDPFGRSFGIVDPIMDPLDAVSRAQAGPVQGTYRPPVANQVLPNQPLVPSDDSASDPAESRPPHLTRSRRFNLDYEVSDAGDSGVARVELWVTKDGGRSWTAFGTDEDRQSPFLVELQSEGTYGFRLLIHNGLGASSPPPQPGETADLWVSVDWTRPQGRIISAQFGDGEQANQLQVTWQITDANLGETPIQLSYADRPSGPWMPLDRPVANTGQHRWQLDFRLAPEIYLRMDIQDRAGNTAQIQYPYPVKTVRVPPAGRIRAVRPIEGL